MVMCVAILAVPTVCIAAPSPMTLAQNFSDPIAGTPAARATSCTIDVATLEDRRSDPELIGVFNRRAVHAPKDREVWLRGIVRALANRGVTPQLPGNEAATESSLRVAIYLERAWVSNVLNDIAASVVFRVDTINPEGVTEQARFRGNQQKITYFSGGEGKIQRSVDSAFAEALDGMAVHLRSRCSAAPPMA